MKITAKTLFQVRHRVCLRAFRMLIPVYRAALIDMKNMDYQSAFVYVVDNHFYAGICHASKAMFEINIDKEMLLLYDDLCELGRLKRDTHFQNIGFFFKPVREGQYKAEIVCLLKERLDFMQDMLTYTPPVSHEEESE